MNDNFALRSATSGGFPALISAYSRSIKSGVEASLTSQSALITWCDPARSNAQASLTSPSPA